MVDQKDVSRLQDKLLKRRAQIFRLRRGLNESWTELQQPEIDRLDEQDRQEIEAIDSALRKMFRLLMCLSRKRASAREECRRISV